MLDNIKELKEYFRTQGAKEELAEQHAKLYYVYGVVTGNGGLLKRLEHARKHYESNAMMQTFVKELVNDFTRFVVEPQLDIKTFNIATYTELKEVLYKFNNDGKRRRQKDGKHKLDISEVIRLPYVDEYIKWLECLGPVVLLEVLENML